MDTDIQSTIDKIREGLLTEEKLAACLEDPRALVRANALIQLQRLQPRRAETVERIALAAMHPVHGAVILMGSVSQRQFAIATLGWLDGELALQAYKQALERLPVQEVQQITRLISQGPVS